MESYVGLFFQDSNLQIHIYIITWIYSQIHRKSYIFHTNQKSYVKMVIMKGQKVGNPTNGLLWPDSATMASLLAISRPRNSIVTVDDSGLELLWPAELINEQVRLRRKADYSLPLAIFAFACSIIVSFIIGPMQLLLLTIGQANYDWVTGIYYPTALKFSMLAAAIISALCLFTLWQTWHARSKHTYLDLALIASSLLQLIIIWVLAQISILQPHHIASILLIAILASLVLVFLISKRLDLEINDRAVIMSMGILAIIGVMNIIGGSVFFAQAHEEIDPIRIGKISQEQAEVKPPELTRLFSDSIFTLCDNQKYQTIYLTENHQSGIFECTSSGEVYSAMVVEQSRTTTIDGSATYLGTTKNSALSLAFPNSRYLYRAMPQLVDENSLILMVQANSEREMLDNVAPAFLEYWKNHHDQKLHLSVFYVRDLSSVVGTRDFILTAALNTLTKTDRLPHGNTLKGYHEEKPINYLFRPDYDLYALNELAEHPEAYSPDAADAFIYNRHTSVTFGPNAQFTENSLKSQLESSLTATHSNN